MKHLYILFGIFFIVSCQQKEKNINETTENEKSNTVEVEEKPSNEVRIVNTSTNTSFILTTLPNKNNLIDLAITGKGFEFPVVDTLKSIYPIEKTFTADLNSDDFEELYIVTKSPDKYNTVMLFGFASYKDKSFGSIYIPDLEASKELPFGYRGQDSIILSGNKIIRSFPLYDKETKNAKLTGDTINIIYKLEKGEANFILQPSINKKSAS